MSAGYRKPASHPVDINYLNQCKWWDKVDIMESGECWLWKQSVGSHGYGQTWDGKSVILSHRVAWILHHNQDIPEGMTVDHICRVRRCCNPGHLRLLSNIDNATDNGQSNKTHCPRNHPYDDINTYIDPKGHRRCRQCAIDRRLSKKQ